MPTFTDTVTVRQLSDGNPNGNCLGQSTTDNISFFAAAPVTQPTAAAQAALNPSGVGAGAGALTHYTSTQTPSSVATITVAEQSVTVTGTLATDLVLINKPTSQAGIAVCAGRMLSANTVKLVFGNLTGATLTPSPSEAYLVTTIPANLQLSAVLSPTVVAANTILEQSFTVTGLDTGMVVQVNKPTTQAGLGVLSARVSAKNTLAITFINPTAAALTPTASETYLIAAFNALAAASQIIEFGVNVGTLSLCATVSAAEQAVTVAGIAATDVMVGVTKPTQQTGLGLLTGRVSAASTIQVAFVNPTAGNLTPTASEVYGVTIFRPSPGAPLTLFTGTIVPTSCAANTTNEQTFTVTGIVSGQPVVVSPIGGGLAGSGVGIAGVRASTTNTLAITFANTTANAVVPPSFTATVGHFNHTIPTAGNFVQLLVSPAQTKGVGLTNAIRSALVSLGLIAGS